MVPSLIYVYFIETKTAEYMVPSLIYELYRTKTAGYMVPSLIYVLYRTETAGYMVPSLIHVLYRTETAGYMVPSLIWGIIGILLNAASMIWQVVPQTLKE